MIFKSQYTFVSILLFFGYGWYDLSMLYWFAKWTIKSRWSIRNYILNCSIYALNPNRKSNILGSIKDNNCHLSSCSKIWSKKVWLTLKQPSIQGLRLHKPPLKDTMKKGQLSISWDQQLQLNYRKEKLPNTVIKQSRTTWISIWANRSSRSLTNLAVFWTEWSMRESRRPPEKRSSCKNIVTKSSDMPGANATFPYEVSHCDF